MCLINESSGKINFKVLHGLRTFLAIDIIQIPEVEVQIDRDAVCDHLMTLPRSLVDVVEVSELEKQKAQQETRDRMRENPLGPTLKEPIRQNPRRIQDLMLGVRVS